MVNEHCHLALGQGNTRLKLHCALTENRIGCIRTFVEVTRNRAGTMGFRRILWDQAYSLLSEETVKVSLSNHPSGSSSPAVPSKGAHLESLQCERIACPGTAPCWGHCSTFLLCSLINSAPCGRQIIGSRWIHNYLFLSTCPSDSASILHSLVLN